MVSYRWYDGEHIVYWNHSQVAEKGEQLLLLFFLSNMTTGQQYPKGVMFNEDRNHLLTVEKQTKFLTTYLSYFSFPLASQIQAVSINSYLYALESTLVWFSYQLRLL